MKKSTISVEIDQDIANRARNAVYWSPGLTLTKLIEDALTKEISTRPESNMPMPKKKTLRSVPRFKQEDEE